MGDEAIAAAREADLKADFALGEEIKKAAENRKSGRSMWETVQQMFLSRGEPVVTAERKRVGKGEVPYSEKYAIKMALQEFNHSDNADKLLIMDVARDVYRPLKDAGIEEDDAGIYVMMQRIAEGDRGGLAEDAKAAIMDITGESDWEMAKKAYTALGTETKGEAAEGSAFDPDLLAQAETGLLNPRGYTPATAKEELASIERRLGPEKYAALQDVAAKYRAILNRSFDEGVRWGVYSREMAERLKATEATYWPFAVLDYFNGRVPAGMRKQTGTVKGVASPWTAALLKALAQNRIVERQKAVLPIIAKLDEDFPGHAGPDQVIDKHHREQPAGPDKANLFYYVDGRLHYRAVDDYIANVLHRADIGSLHAITSALGSKSYGILHPLYVSWSLAWQANNLQRDFKRTYKMMNAAHAGKPTYRQAIAMFTDIPKLLKAYGETAGIAMAHARGKDVAYIRAMLQDRALGRAFHSFDPYEGSTTLERELQRAGILKPPHEGVKGTLMHVGRPVEVAGVMQETWTKAAAYKLLGQLGITGKSRAYFTRNYVGTPDSTDRGLASDVSNSLFLYSNVITAGWRADMEVATHPKTAAGYWMRALLIDFLPKYIMAMATLGWLGEKYQEWMEYVPSYDKEKYIIVPVPPFFVTSAKGAKKAMYLRMPHDDTNRIIAAVSWALLMEGRPYAPSRAIGMVAGEFPGVNPLVELPLQWVAFMGNQNPRDSFRSRDVVPSTEWTAGGWPRAREMLKYSLGQFGVASSALDWMASLGGKGLQQGSDPADRSTAERIISHIPGVSRVLRVSDRGLTEERWWELDWEARERARIRADLPEEVRKAVRRRSSLNRLGEERLNDAELAERAQLNGWYRTYYQTITRDMELARDAKNRDAYRDAVRRIRESLAAPVTQRPGNAPRPPSPPRPPGRSR
jgi:hypothetical protein